MATMTINQIKKEYGLSDNYIRKSIKSGALRVQKGFVPGTNIPRNEVLNVEEWRATRQHSKREDGRTRFVMYMNEQEQAQLAKLIAEHPFLALVQKAYVKTEDVEEVTE